MAMTGLLLSFVGHKKEQLKWRIVGSVLVSVCIAVTLIFSPTIYTGPIVDLLAR